MAICLVQKEILKNATSKLKTKQKSWISSGRSSEDAWTGASAEGWDGMAIAISIGLALIPFSILPVL